MGVTLAGRKITAVVFGVIASLSALNLGPAVAQVANFSNGGPVLPEWEDLPEWNGLWERGGDIVWNDALPPGAPQHAPFNDAYMAEFEKAQEITRARNLQGLGRQQAPGGAVASITGMMVALRPLDIQINRNTVLITNEQNAIRRIYTDGRDHPEHPLPSPTGHSIGYWEDGALYVDTCCTMEGGGLTGGGTHSAAMHIKEKFWSPEPGKLMVDILVEDPEAFTGPWTTVKTYYHRPDWEPVGMLGDDTGRDFPVAAEGEDWRVTAKAPTPVSELAAGAFNAPASGKVLTDDELRPVTARAVGNLAPETVEIIDVVRTDTSVTWKGKTRTVTWSCAAALDGTGAFCGGG